MFAAVIVPGSPAADPSAPQRPQRVVSVNLCADLLLLTLLPHERIASLSPYAANEAMSPLAAQAADIAVNHAQVEEILQLAPDLVLAGRFNSPETIALLQRLGVPLLVLDVPSSLAETRAQIRRVAQVLGEAASGERLVDDMDRRMAEAVQGDALASPVAAVIRANGYTAGAGTLIDDLLSAARLDNLARISGIRGWGTIDLETMLVGRPDLLVLDVGDEHPSLAAASLAHPALRALGERVPVLAMPARLWLCAGPWMAEAVEHLASARRALQGVTDTP
jgi:iron complex transport system substrate-binding protein